MLNWLVSTSLKLRVVVIALTVLVLVAGPRIIQNMPLDVFPEFAPPLVEVQTEGPGLSATEIESLITVPIENVLNGVPSLDTLRSKSVLGLSSVVLIFQQNTDLMAARQIVAERLATLSGSLPQVAHAPVILQPLSSTSRVMKIGITSDSLDQMGMTRLARWAMRPRLMAVPGVANVAIWGQRDRQMQILVDPDRLHAHEVPLQQVITSASEALTVGAGGYMDTPNQRIAITHPASLLTAADIARAPLDYRDGTPFRLGDVARVVEGFPPPIGDAIINEEPGLLLIVEKQRDANTLQVTRGVEAAIESLRPGLRDLEIDTTIFRPATFIEMSLDNLNRALILGSILVVIVLVIFLYDWRTAVISLLAIPLSLMTAVLVLYYRGVSINTMVLAGLVIALGEVVDDAIIDVENILRRLRLNRAAGNPESSFMVILKASLEVRSAIVYASLVVVLVFLPIFFLPGLSGAFFRPLATSYILAVMASLAVALTLTPALSMILLPSDRHQREAPVTRWLKRHYLKVLPPFVSKPKMAAGLLFGLLATTALTVPFLGEEFLPNFKEYDFLMHWLGKPGTSLEAMNRTTIQASRELRAIEGVRNFGSHIGRAEVADEVVGPDFVELWISMDPSVDYDSTVAKIQATVAGYPGIFHDVLTYLKERIKEVLTGASATIVVRIYGPDLDVLRAKAEEAGKVMAGINGVSDLKVEQQVLIPKIEVAYKPDTAAQFGLTPGQLRSHAAVLAQGVKVGEIYDQQQIFDVVVRGEDHLRGNIAALQNLRINTPSGANVLLRDVADVRIVPTPNVVNRENASRRIDVTANVGGGQDLGIVAREVESRVRAMSFEAGYHPEFIGEYAERQAAARQLLLLSLLALVGIWLILHADFKSTKLSLLVFLSIPFALVGGVAATFLTGGILSLGSLVGFVTVLGIAARNGIMLVSHWRHLEEHEGMPFGRDLVLRGAEERLAPIIMTALATGLALMPIVLGGNLPGHEIEHPLAVVIVGGLVTSTLLNLLLMPALYLRWGGITRLVR
jgi:CzcA family heavy metal efflux pump